MQTFEHQLVDRTFCAPKRASPEKLNALHWAQNETIEDLDLTNCELLNNGLATYGAPVNRSTARNIRLKNCQIPFSFHGIGAVFDEIIIDGLRITGSAILGACVFRHVVLKRHCGAVSLHRDVCYDDKDRNSAFYTANTIFYETVDWAIDISNVRAAAFEINGCIPARLIRRNAEEQVVMTREIAASGDWNNYEPPDYFQYGIAEFLRSRADDNVFVAPRRSKHFKEEAEYFHRLRRAGLVT